LSLGFFALLDDIAMLMDDISTMAKSATKNTAAILGDDLAVNAAKASNFSASRELPVIWKITKGSFLNKIILIPLIMALNYYYPKVVIYLLIGGAIYLAYEGTHALWNYIFPHSKEEKEEKKLSEDEKVKSAILTDFILSIEIVLISLNSVREADFITQVIVVTLIAFGATIGVYGLVALLVKIDDFGLFIAKDENKNSFQYKFGMFLVKLLPIIIRILGVVGTFAMLYVAGEIFLHYIHTFEEIFHSIPTYMAALIVSILVGGVVMIVVYLFSLIKGLFKTPLA